MILTTTSIIMAVSVVNACCDGIWIDYKLVEGSYTWGDSCSSTYENWATDQPDNYGGNEMFAAISYTTDDGTWNDYETYDLVECGCQTDNPGNCAAINGWRTIEAETICYYISENTTDWNSCSDHCHELTAEMLCIEDVNQNNLISGNQACTTCAWVDKCAPFGWPCCPPLWLGLEQETTDGEWSWVDETCLSDYTNWNRFREPAHYSTDENFAVLGQWDLPGTWYTAPGEVWDEAMCGCQIITEEACDTEGGWLSYTSESDVQTCYYISGVNNRTTWEGCREKCDELGADRLCINNIGENMFLFSQVACLFQFPQCFWHESHLREEALWYGLGVPCFVVMFVVTVHMILIIYNGAGSRNRGSVQMDNDDTSGKSPSVRRIDLSVIPNPLNSAYGRLLDIPYEASETETQVSAHIEVDETVNKWLLRGAVAEIVFAMGLGGIGCTMLLHHHFIACSLFLDAIEGFVCFCSKVTIVIASYYVYTNLSPLSISVTGWWVHIFAAAKFMMGLASFNIFVGYMIFGSEDDDPENFCLAAHFFYSALLSIIVFQTITGVALYGVHINVVNAIGDINRFYDITGVWWAILVLGTFGVGISTWLVGADFMILDERDGFQKIGVYFSIASFFQACAGTAIFCINSRVRAHFRGPKGEKTIQMMEKK